MVCGRCLIVSALIALVGAKVMRDTGAAHVSSADVRAQREVHQRKSASKTAARSRHATVETESGSARYVTGSRETESWPELSEMLKVDTNPNIQAAQKECPEANIKAIDAAGCKNVTSKMCDDVKEASDKMPESSWAKSCSEYAYKKCCGSSCFGGDALVQTSLGRVALRRLRAGDLVHTAAGLEPVVDFMHSAAVSAQHMLKLTHARGSLTVSPSHLLFKADGTAIPAHAVVVGQALSPGVVVSEISTTEAKDFFAPMTTSGTLVVDDIMASTYAAVPAHAVGHAAAVPLRYLAAASASLSAAPEVPQVVIARASL